jgi:hypothetical protein
MPPLGLEPNTCSLHEFYHSTLQPELLLNTRKDWNNRLYFLSALEHGLWIRNIH